MRDTRKYFPVNWIDGMKINKNHFIDQDNAYTDALQEVASLHLSPVRYGILPVAATGDDNFNVKISLDNLESLRVSVLSCNAVTTGGLIICLPSPTGPSGAGSPLTAIFPLAAGNEATWWIFLFIHPFDKQASGSADLTENPPRLPYLQPSYTLEIINDTNFRQYANHPYAVPVGKIAVNAGTVKVDNDYIPPCFSVSASPDLTSLHSELDKYLAELELYCSRIVQKIFKRNQQNEISELVMFVCDRVIVFLSYSITAMRSTMLYEPPVYMFAEISALARLIKNAIDMRIGSGKDELLNYLTEWCELKQGELESLLSTIANVQPDNNDINKNIQKVVVFVKVTLRLFETLSKLEFIGKRKESGIFVKEEPAANVGITETQVKARRRFFGQ